MANFKNHGEAIEGLLRALPYSNHISNLDLSQADAIRFNWRDARYKLTFAGQVDEVDRGCLAGSDRALLVGHCIAQADLLHALKTVR